MSPLGMDCSALQMGIVLLITNMNKRCLVVIFIMRGRLADGLVWGRIIKEMNRFNLGASRVYISSFHV